MAQPYVGEIRMFAGNFAPVGWMFCDGQLLPISEYETLFQLIARPTAETESRPLHCRICRAAYPCILVVSAAKPFSWVRPAERNRLL
jgi:hypothetical protein